MIALYKFPQSTKLDVLLKDCGFQTARFNSVKSILGQIMNPMIVLVPHLFKREVEPLPVPVIPVAIHITDIVETIEKNNLHDHADTPFRVVASREELEWLHKEYAATAPSYPLQYVELDQFLTEARTNKTFHLIPEWAKTLLPEHIWPSLYPVSPSASSLLRVLQLVSSLERFTDQIARERYQVAAIVDSSHDGVIAVDREGNITVANQHAKTLLHLEGEVIGRKITDFIPDSDMIRVLQTGNVEMGDIANSMDRKLMINRFPVIVMGQVVGAVSNFKEITDIQKLELKLRKLLHKTGLEAKYRISDIVGESPGIREARDLASRFARTGATVLITGESGTGKELFAQGIHLASDRALGPFVAVNCAALPESLLESELFGYEEGAFTGARKGGKAGLFELAHGGTLFLDEIGEMPLRIQALLLRVLQEKTVRRVGGERIIPVDVRIIAATNRNLQEEMQSKQFRTDLYYRLNVLSLEIPPLRERLSDIPALVASIVEQLNEQRDPKITSIDPEIYRRFFQHDWPGNIRELRNIVERMVVLAAGTSLTLHDAAYIPQRERRSLEQEEPTMSIFSLKKKEKELIISALQKYENNKTLAAKSLGIDRTTLWRKLKEHQLE